MGQCRNRPSYQVIRALSFGGVAMVLSDRRTKEIADADWHELAIERIYLVFCSIITHILTPQNTLILQNFDLSSCILRAFCDIAPCFGLVQFDATPCAQDPKARDLVQVGFPLCPND